MKSVPPWFYRQSAVIPYRVVDGEVEVLLITSRRGRRWVIPKGVVELTLSPAESAMREAFEEAGAIGRVSDRAVGTFEYEKWGGICRVQVFLMKVDTLLDIWPEANERNRKWTRPGKAADVVREKGLKALLAAVADLVARGE